MCRITGFYHTTTRPPALQETLHAMRDSLAYGGPDQAGSYLDAKHGVGLGHRRLSILDLSAAGQQPMQYQDWVICFNGEVYNFQTIRQELEQLGHQFTSQTDTEVLLKGWLQWGKALLPRCRGFFAIAFYHQLTGELTLVRDRFGVKPLYWYWKDGVLLFASELKAFHQHPAMDKTLDQNALSLYLQQGYIPAPHCIFRYAHKLAPGSLLTLSDGGTPQLQQYWSPRELYAQTQVSTQSEGELLEELEGLLRESFKYRLIADVPVGAFLSGGIDSSMVTALLQQQGGQTLRTFTIGFEDPAYNEAQHAKAVAQHLGTQHQEFYCTEADFRGVLPLLPELYDEPFGDSSGIPTYLVARMAREQVTVSLSADGGDELFGGYTKYEVAQQFYPKIQRLPRAVKSLLRGIGKGIDPLWLERNSSRIPVLKRYKNISHKFPKLLQALEAKDVVEFFNRASIYQAPAFLTQLHQIPHLRYKSDLELDPNRLISYLGLIDVETFLEGDVMTKVDRATMAVALEGRDPFLDESLLAFGLKLPDQFKIQGKNTKYLLRQLLYRYVPQELIERPKQGFSIPVEQWLRGLLAEQLRAMVADEIFVQTMHLNSHELQQLIGDFLSRRRFINPHFIWFLYTLHQWYLRWL